MKTSLVVVLALALCQVARGQGAATQQGADSLRMEQLQETVISAVRASGDAPFAVAHIGRVQLEQFSSTGQELPLLFSRTPGILAWSENGLGTGTTYMRIRGAGGAERYFPSEILTRPLNTPTYTEPFGPTVMGP